MPIKLNGATSGSVELDVPAAVSGGDVNLTIPGAGTLDRLERPGNILQYKFAEYTTRTSVAVPFPFDDTVPQNTEGTEIITLSITPTSASNKLVIKFFLPLWDANSIIIGICALFQDSSSDALAAAAEVISEANHATQLGMVHIMDAGTTSATTFKIRVGPNGSVMYLNRRGNANYLGSTTLHATLQITEIAI
jgi:hypothetical protein